MILSLTPNFGRSCELQSMCNIHHCYHRKISQPRERERERETLYLHEKKKDALYLHKERWIIWIIFPKHTG